jgi:hypothetical protein
MCNSLVSEYGGSTVQLEGLWGDSGVRQRVVRVFRQTVPTSVETRRVELHIDRELCVRRAQRTTHVNVTRALANEGATQQRTHMSVTRAMRRYLHPMPRTPPLSLQDVNKCHRPPMFPWLLSRHRPNASRRISAFFWAPLQFVRLLPFCETFE